MNDKQKELETLLEGAKYALEEAQSQLKQLRRCISDIENLIEDKEDKTKF